ncbi:MAG: OB-fold nucleic acid binding domain-containing protein, partial [Pseudomonadota bacterium]
KALHLSLKILPLEKEALGFYCSGHPCTLYQEEFDIWGVTPLIKIRQTERTISIAGVITQMRVMFNKKQEKIAFITLQDATGTFELGVFSDQYPLVRDKLKEDHILCIYGTVQKDEQGNLRFRVKSISDLAETRARFRAVIALHMLASDLTHAQVQTLKQSLEPHRSAQGVPLYLTYQSKEGKAHLKFGSAWRVRPEPSLMIQLQKICGIGSDKQCILYPDHPDYPAGVQAQTALNTQTH